jgi:hypothetical protein
MNELLVAAKQRRLSIGTIEDGERLGDGFDGRHAVGMRRGTKA